MRSLNQPERCNPLDVDFSADMTRALDELEADCHRVAERLRNKEFSKEERKRLAAPLDVPPLEPIPQDHVLTRTFYLLQDFPGRYMGRDVWVEAAAPDAELVEGMPFRNLNDNVTPIVIGGNDWAAAWAVDENGGRMSPSETDFPANGSANWRFGSG